MGVSSWDVSADDPIVSLPRRERIDRVAGEPIAVVGYSPEATIAEKGASILERNVTTTRLRY